MSEQDSKLSPNEIRALKQRGALYNSSKKGNKSDRYETMMNNSIFNEMMDNSMDDQRRIKFL